VVAAKTRTQKLHQPRCWHDLLLPLQVPLLWNRSPEAAAAKLNGIAKELGVEGAAAAALLMGAPALASINMPGVVRDRVEAVSDALGVSTAQVGFAVTKIAGIV
jgi:hypothetical protein